MMEITLKPLTGVLHDSKLGKNMAAHHILQNLHTFF